jgi:hypothetical protein
MPGLLKIGCSGRSAAVRACELSASTGIPAPFVVEWSWPVSDWKAVEALTHNRLSDCRPNYYREFFCCTVTQARRSIRRAAAFYLRPWWWKLLAGRTSAPSGPVRRRRGADPLAAWGWCGLLLAVVLIALLKPSVPGWVPPSVAHSIMFIARHAPSR